MKNITIACDKGQLNGIFALPSNAKGIIIFAHGSGSSHQSPRNQMVALTLERAGFATLLFDLLTPEEEEMRFDIDLLTKRLVLAIDWAKQEAPNLPIGLFGANTGSAAALEAAAHRDIFAIVSRGGRPDLAKAHVYTPTLLIVGGNDEAVLTLNEKAKLHMKGVVQLKIVSRATHLFEEPGALEEVARLACSWFLQHYCPPSFPELRNQNTPTPQFRKAALDAIQELAGRLYELPNPCLIPILRSGIAMLPPFLHHFPDAPIGFLGMHRDEKTLHPQLYYQKLPDIKPTDTVLLLDPMLATGGSTLFAIDLLLKKGAVEPQIHICSLIVSKPGLANVQNKRPKVHFHYLIADDKLNAAGYIDPGLGDFGDRFCGVKG